MAGQKDDKQPKVTIRSAPEPPKKQRYRSHKDSEYFEPLEESRNAFYHLGEDKAWKIAGPIKRKDLEQTRSDIRAAAKIRLYKVETRSVLIAKGNTRGDDMLNLYFMAYDAPEGYYG